MVIESTLEQVLALAIGNPEVGAVNFNILYSLLCLVIRRLETLQPLAPEPSQDVWDDFEAPLGPPGWVPSAEEVPVVRDYRTLSPQAAATDPTAQAMLDRRLRDQAAKPVVEKRRASDTMAAADDDRRWGPAGRVAAADADYPGSTIVMSKTSWTAVQRRMRVLEDQVESMFRSGPSDLLEQIRKFSPDMPPTQMADLVQKLQVSHRIETNEQLITKLSSMLEDNMAELQSIKGAISAVLGTSRAHALLDDVSSLKEEATKQRTASQESLVKMDAHHDELKSIKEKLKAVEMAMPGTKLTETFVTTEEYAGNMREIRTVLGLPGAAAVVSFVASGMMVDDERETPPTASTLSVFVEGMNRLAETVGANMDREFFKDLMSASGNLINQVETVKNSATFIERYRLEHQYVEQALMDLIRKLVELGFDVNHIREQLTERIQQAKARLLEKGIAVEVMTSTPTGGLASKSKSRPTGKSTSDDAVSKSAEGSRSGSVSGSDSDESDTEARSALNKRLDDLEKELREVMRKMERLMLSQSHSVGGASTGGEDGGQMEDAKLKILELFESVEGLNEQINQLVDDGMDKQKQLQKVNEMMASLKESKAEQEEVSLLKEEKADKMMIEDKVDHALFESSLNEVSQEIAALEDKINYIDECTQATLTNLSDAMGRKVERAEIAPLREYINSKVKMLLLKIKKLQSSSGPDDGAGTRKQLLRKFHCISCDKPVVAAGMPWGTPHAPGQPFQATGGNRPFTTYEIELVRQSKRMGLGKKFLFHPTMSEMARARRLEIDATRAKLIGGVGTGTTEGEPMTVANVPDNLDTRYCGGSHTLTFPFQRVGRPQGHVFDNFPVIRQEVDEDESDRLAVKGSHFAPEPDEKKAVVAEVIKEQRAAESAADGETDEPFSSIPSPGMFTAGEGGAWAETEPGGAGGASDDTASTGTQSMKVSRPMSVMAKKSPSKPSSPAVSAATVAAPSARGSLSRTSSGMGAKFTAGVGGGSVGGGGAPSPKASTLTARTGSVTAIRSGSGTAVRSPSTRSAAGTPLRSPQSSSATQLTRTPPNGRKSQERRPSTESASDAPGSIP